MTQGKCKQGTDDQDRREVDIVSLIDKWSLKRHNPAGTKPKMIVNILKQFGSDM